MQVVFFFLFLFIILCLTPYPVSVEAIFDGAKEKGGVQVKVFGVFTVFRLVAVVEDKILKIYTKKDKYMFIEIVETAVNFLSGSIGGKSVETEIKKAVSPVWLLKAINFDEINIIAEHGNLDNIEQTVFAGALINVLTGALYAAIKNLSPETRVNMTHSTADSKNFRVYAKSIISVRPADIITGYIKRRLWNNKTKLNKS